MLGAELPLLWVTFPRLTHSLLTAHTCPLRSAEVTAASCLETQPENLKQPICPGPSVPLPCGFQECSVPQSHGGMSPWELCQCWLGWGLSLLPQSWSRWGVSRPSLVWK